MNHITNPKPKMSAAAHLFVNEMFDHGVFVKIDPSRLVSDRPELIIACFDPHRVHDLVGHYRTLDGACRCCPPLTYPGGALVIPAHSKLSVTKNGFRADEVMLDAIQMAVEELGATRIRPYAHFPCLAAHKAGMTDLETLSIHAAAKDRLRERFPNADITLMVHIDWVGYPEARDREMETYKFDRKAFNSYLALRNVETSAA